MYHLNVTYYYLIITFAVKYAFLLSFKAHVCDVLESDKQVFVVDLGT